MPSQPSHANISSFQALYPELASFLTWFVDADLDGLSDKQVAANYAVKEFPKGKAAALEQGKRLLTQEPFPWKEIGDYANRFFETPDAARIWLNSMLQLVEAA